MKALRGVVVTVALLAGCARGGGEYVGKWFDAKSKQALEIERNGDAFMIRKTGPSFLTGKIETRNIPATLKDGTLQIQSDGFGAVTMMVDKASGNLTDGQREYKKVD